jgi:hypothetical protein
MTHDRDEFEERSVEQAFKELTDGIEPPSDDELRALARTAAATPRRPVTATLSRTRLPLRLRWSVAAAAVALLVGSGLGFGVGSSVTPSVQAGTSFAGTGFLPAQGWNVVQSGTVTSSKRATAIAANVPIDADRDLGKTLTATLASLPAHGIVIHATFTTRGDPTGDAMFRERELPLQIASAKLVSPGRYRLRVGTGGYNVDARIYFGTASPSAETMREAQLQLSRLVVAPERVTLSARPTSLRWSQPATLFGAVSSGKPDEDVILQAKDCGQKTFTGVASILTHEGGTFTTEFARAINSTIRAVWKGEASGTIELRQQPRVELRRRSGGRFAIGIGSRWQFWHKRALLQRRVGSRWTTVKTVVLTDVTAHAGTGSTWTEEEFTVKVPRGSVLRAVLPADQAKPCYLAAVSATLRV